MRRTTPLPDDAILAAADRVAIAGSLRRIRLEQGLSLREVADRAGVAHSLISHLEHGRRNVTLDTLSAIAGALGARVVVGLEPDTLQGERREQLLERLRDLLTDAAAEDVRDFAQWMSDFQGNQAPREVPAG
jgi:transcriptional regulator with XRE-family HTH domain